MTRIDNSGMLLSRRLFSDRPFVGGLFVDRLFIDRPFTDRPFTDKSGDEIQRASESSKFVSFNHLLNRSNYFIEK